MIDSVMRVMGFFLYVFLVMFFFPPAYVWAEKWWHEVLSTKEKSAGQGREK